MIGLITPTYKKVGVLLLTPSTLPLIKGELVGVEISSGSRKTLDKKAI